MAEFPQYLMKQRASRKDAWTYSFHPFRELGRIYNNGFVEIEIGYLVILDENLNCRSITEEERSKIVEAADGYCTFK